MQSLNIYNLIYSSEQFYAERVEGVTLLSQMSGTVLTLGNLSCFIYLKQKNNRQDWGLKKSKCRNLKKKKNKKKYIFSE